MNTINYLINLKFKYICKINEKLQSKGHFFYSKKGEGIHGDIENNS